MIQIRHGLFETNSSSACTLVVMIAQVEGLVIPSKVQIDSSARPWDEDINGAYVTANMNDQADRFLGLLKHAGVNEIYVDGKLVDADPEVRDVKFMPVECILARCFGDYKSFSEWQGWGDEYDGTKFLNVKEIYEIQNKLKDPNYVVVCQDGEDGTEIEWKDLPYSKRVITADDLANFEEASKYAYDEPELEEPDYEEWLEDSKKFEKYEGDEDYDRLTDKAKEQGSKDQRYIRRNGYRDKKYKHL